MPVWISFKELRQQLRFADVLRHYGVQVKITGDICRVFLTIDKMTHKLTVLIVDNSLGFVWNRFNKGFKV